MDEEKHTDNIDWRRKNNYRYNKQPIANSEHRGDQKDQKRGYRSTGILVVG